MNNNIKTTSQNNNSLLKNALTILLLITTPIAGIVLTWVLTKWPLVAKIIITIIAALYSILQAIFIILYAVMGNTLLPQDTKAAKDFLENRNGKNYSIIEAKRTSSGLGSATFESVTLREDNSDSIKFYVYRCVSRCGTIHSQDFKVDELKSD